MQLHMLINEHPFSVISNHPRIIYDTNSPFANVFLQGFLLSLHFFKHTGLSLIILHYTHILEIHKRCLRLIAFSHTKIVVWKYEKPRKILIYEWHREDVWHMSQTKSAFMTSTIIFSNLEGVDGVTSHTHAYMISFGLIYGTEQYTSTAMIRQSHRGVT